MRRFPQDDVLGWRAGVHVRDLRVVLAFAFSGLTDSPQRLQVFAARNECISLHSVRSRVDAYLLLSEIVLSLLLAKFTFAPPSGKTITWNLSNVRFPSVGDNPKPSMPMMVGLYEKMGKGE